MHVDTVGGIRPTSREGHKWAIILHDEHSSLILASTVSHKGELFNHIKYTWDYLNAKFNAKIKIIHSDNAKEYR